MHIEKAIQKAEEIDEIKAILNKGGFLVSGFVILDCEGGREDIKEWNLNYHDPKTKNIVSVHVNDERAKKDVEDEPLREKEYSAFEKKVKITGEKAIEIAEKAVDILSCNKMIVSLQKDEDHEYWSVAFIFGANIKSVKIDIETGEVISTDSTNLAGDIGKSAAS